MRDPRPVPPSWWARFTNSRGRVAAAAALGLTVIAAGAGTAYVVAALRGQPAAVASATPVATPSAAGAPSEAASVTTSPTPTQAPSATATPTPSALPTQPSPSVPDNVVAGTWEAIRPAPNTDRLKTSAAVRLADGRLAVLHTEFLLPDNQPCSWLYAPSTDSWQVAEIADPPGWKGCYFTYEAFTQGPDGRFYSPARIIDTSAGPWIVEDAPWRIEEGPDTIGMTPAGDVYTAQQRCSRVCRTHVYAVDGTTGALSEVSVAPFTGDHQKVIAGPTSNLLYLGGVDDDFETGLLATYDVTTGAWAALASVPFRAHWDRALRTSDGWVWVMAFDTPGHELYARHPDSGRWLSVPLPGGLARTWSPVLVEGADGRIYAMDAREPYVFEPDE